VWSLSVVLIEPLVKVDLKLTEDSIDLLPERHMIELVEYRLLEPLADAVGLRALHLGLGVVDVVKGQIELVLVPLEVAAELTPAVGEDPQCGSSKSC